MLSFVGPSVINIDSYVKQFIDILATVWTLKLKKRRVTGFTDTRKVISNLTFHLQIAFVTYGRVLVIPTSPATALEFTKLQHHAPHTTFLLHEVNVPSLQVTHRSLGVACRGFSWNDCALRGGFLIVYCRCVRLIQWFVRGD
jgi:hypothetical protein